MIALRDENLLGYNWPLESAGLICGERAMRAARSEADRNRSELDARPRGAELDDVHGSQDMISRQALAVDQGAVGAPRSRST